MPRQPTQKPERARRRLAAALAALAAASGPSTLAAPSPEEQTFQVSKLLKPISDDDWKLIAGGKVSEEYQVVKGDTLYDISARLFGDAKYWPKVWALNNGKIANPHVILPGQAVAFMPGTGSSLPAFGLGGTVSDALSSGEAVQVADNSATPAVPQGRSKEWKDLPVQDWETVHLALPSEVDPLGFDRRSKVVRHTSTGFETEAFPSSQKLSALGEIRGSRSDGRYLSMGDTVFVEPRDGMQVGERYTITKDPYFLKSRKSDRAGYSYLNLGTIKVIAVRDGLFVAEIVSGKAFIERGAYVIPLVPRVVNVTPIPGPRALEGVLILDRNISTYTTAQHKLVYIDRGSADGVQPGMVFRAYQHRDPTNDSTITNADFIINADFMVLQTTESISIALSIRSLVQVYENDTVVLLTDVTDLLRSGGIQERDPEQRALDDELDNLDRLDPASGLGPDEERELKQLEQWQSNPPEGGAAPTDDELDGGAPEGEVPPPPTGGGSDEELFGAPPPEGGEAAPAVPESELPSEGEITPSEGETPQVTDQVPSGETPTEELPPPPPSPEAGEPGVEPIEEGESVNDPFGN
ncbi:MAG: LysM peptidoglycan-binding domain-containing protein [Bdellovibrionales bacterium]|nr:LysM peptidoglycan-binding domain-containing protein [Bdellovibrionales bacterium]